MSDWLTAGIALLVLFVYALIERRPSTVADATRGNTRRDRRAQRSRYSWLPSRNSRREGPS